MTDLRRRRRAPAEPPAKPAENDDEPSPPQPDARVLRHRELAKLDRQGRPKGLERK